MGEVRQAPSTGERALRVTATAFALTVCALAYVDVAGAIGPTSFNMSPSSGPVGTGVNVSGSGCAPGILLQSNDFIAITASTVPPTTLQHSVASDGSWSGSFTIPSGTPAGPVVVEATCVTDGLDSLLTIYAANTFTVSGAIVTPTTPAVPSPTLPTVPTLPTLPGTTLPGSTATTQPANPGDPGTPNPGTSSPVSVPHDRIDDGTPGGSGGGSSDIGDGVSTGAGGAGSGATGTGTSGEGGKGGKSPSDARAAELSSPDLAVSKGKGSSALAWLLWLLALSIPVGGAGFYLWMRYARRPHVPDSEPEVS